MPLLTCLPLIVEKYLIQASFVVVKDTDTSFKILNCNLLVV